MSAIEKALIQEYATAAREAVLAQAIDALKNREDTRSPVQVEKSCDWDARDFKISRETLYKYLKPES